ncbi:menaquinone biosynthetic enzyme MqnA/MqnD family protein [Pelosinus propionicus]|uniref:Chorismate dehydratase n=1 Tax=Pelosinus propionicus DSM 13327 TaxID=1123291 RepID=A0A1I4M2H8_9FIRM|nr:menaquinone biosynthesis protein [Pelosinus propionicus]SFL97598.1 futalosine synthase [Pelosinus propionicus DSM 13327]
MNSQSLGNIKFINCLPLHFGLSHGGFGERLPIYSATPAELNQLIVTEQLNISPVSSIIYAQNSEKLVVLPNVSISAEKALESIILVSKYPIEQLKQARIALTSKSATSHGLLKIIMHHAYQASPEYFVSPLSLGEGVLDNAEAVLFIGDDALMAYHHQVAGYYYYDLGGEWKKLTGLPMVYAVWVVNRKFAEMNKEYVQMVYEKVTGGFRYGLTHIADAAHTLQDKFSLTSEQIIHYIGLLNYQFSPAHEEALLRYYKMAHGLGLSPKITEIEFAKVVK